MNKEKILKELSQLYIGQNPEKLAKNYYITKYKQILFLVAAAMVVLFLCIFKDISSSSLEADRGIARNETGEGKETIILQMRTEEGDWQEIEFELYPKEYSNEELEGLFLDASDNLWEEIKKDNENFEKVVSDLDLIQEMKGYPFTIQWTSKPEGYIDEKGHIINLNRKIDEVIQLQAVFSYEDWKKENYISVHIVREATEDFLVSLKQQLEKMETNSRKNKEFYLPKDFEDNRLEWRYPPGNTGIVLGILFIFLIPLIAYEKDKEIHAMTIKRKEQLQESFSEFITKLTLLLEAGLSIRSAMFYMVEDYQKISYKQKIYLYEELTFVCRQIKNGMPEKDGYELLAQRCSLPCYRKTSAMLIQHLYKGGNYILEELKTEALKATEEQKRIVQKKGEEIGTKLLFPMLLMLGIVMIFIMVPALFSFQI